MTIASLIKEIHIWKKDATCILLLGIIVITSWIPRFRGPIDLRWDAGVYYVLGTSLAHGKGYRLLNEPGEILAIQYPPGLPAVIAIEQLILRSDDPVRVGTYLRLSWCVLSLLYGVCAFLLGRLFLPLGYAFLLSATCLLNYEMYFLSTLCFAELPFALCSTLFGYLYLRNNSGRLRQVLVPSAAIASYLIRSTGIALLGAWIADAALRKRYREAIARTIVALIPVILWHSYIHIVESSGDYRKPYYAYQRDPSMFYNVSYSTNVSLKSPFQPELGFVTTADLFVRVADNLKIIPRNLGEAVSAKEGFWKGHLTRLNRMIGPLVVPSWSVQVILVCLGFIAVAGMAWEFACREWFIPIYLLLTVGAVCMTTWVDQFPRYLAPIEPFLLIACFSLLLEVKTLFRNKSLRVNQIASIVTISTAWFLLWESAISCVVGYRNFRDRAVYRDAAGGERQYTLFHYPQEVSEAETGLKWLVGHARPSDIVVVSMPQWVYLKTGLKTVMPPLEADPLKAQQLIDTVPATFVVLDQLLMEDDFNKRFRAVVHGSSNKWRVVYRSSHGEFDIYQRVGLGPGDKPYLGRSGRSGSLRF